MKRLFCFLLALTIVLSVSSVALAECIEAPDGSDIEIIAVESGESTRAEETRWYFRVLNGMVQKRLWSLTYGRWLTDWIDVAPMRAAERKQDTKKDRRADALLSFFLYVQ